MRRFLAVAFLGLAVAATATDASAQGRGGRGGGRRGGAPDSARVARGDTAFRRRMPDSLRQKRLDSLRAAGGHDSVGGRGRGRGPGGFGPEGRGRGPGGPGGRGGAGLMGIQLNDNEKSAIKTINEKYRAELEQLREANKDAQPRQNPQLGEQVKGIMERQQAEIRAALTAEHQAQFDANQAKMKEQLANGGGRRGRRPPVLRDR